jgi:hypothetical protein
MPFLSKDFLQLHSFDYSADTYRRSLFVACLFACGIITYFAYVYGTDGTWAEVQCGKMSELVCGLVQGLVTWAAIMVQLTVLGLFFIGLDEIRGISCEYRRHLFDDDHALRCCKSANESAIADRKFYSGTHKCVLCID